MIKNNSCQNVQIKFPKNEWRTYSLVIKYTKIDVFLFLLVTNARMNKQINKSISYNIIGQISMKNVNNINNQYCFNDLQILLLGK